MNNIDVAITGGSGKIGTALTRKYLENDYSVAILDIKKPSKEFKDKIFFKKINLIDFCEVFSVIKDLRPNIIQHLAAVFQRTEETPEFRHYNHKNNIIGTHNLLEAAYQLEVENFLFASSYLVYDPLQYLHSKPSKPVDLFEGDRIAPRNLVGSSKYYGEQELFFYNKIGLKGISLRIYRVYGINSNDIISRWIKKALKGDILNVYGEEQHFDFIHAEDVAQGCFKASEHKTTGIYNLGSGRPTLISVILKLIGDLSNNDGLSLKIQKDQKFKGPYENSFANIGKIKTKFNYKPEINIEEGINSVYEFIKHSINFV